MDIGLLIYLAFWYLGNYYYNIQNKNASNASGGSTFAMTIATAQLGIGVIYAVFLWVAPDARKPPQITASDFLKMIPAGVCSAGAHAASVFSLAAGGVAFGQIVKAAEPAFAAVIGTFVYGKKISIYKWLCLIPIIGGVVLAALKQLPDGRIELDFTWGSLIGALVANAFAAFKGNESKKLIDDKEFNARVGTVGNQFALMTIVSFIVSVPLMFFREGPKLHEFVTLFKTKEAVWTNVIYSGLTFYGYNELATMTLKKISAVSNSVANTAKRVVVIVGSAIVFKEDISTLKAAGCFICIAGVFLDSIIDDIMKPKPKADDKKAK